MPIRCGVRRLATNKPTPVISSALCLPHVNHLHCTRRFERHNVWTFTDFNVLFQTLPVHSATSPSLATTADVALQVWSSHLPTPHRGPHANTSPPNLASIGVQRLMTLEHSRRQRDLQPRYSQLRVTPSLACPTTFSTKLGNLERPRSVSFSLMLANCLHVMAGSLGRRTSFRAEQICACRCTSYEA